MQMYPLFHSVCGSMNMAISPVSTHSQLLTDPLGQVTEVLG